MFLPPSVLFTLNFHIKIGQKAFDMLFLPPYSLNLRLCKRIWKWMRESMIVYRFHATREEIVFLESISEMLEKVLQRISQVHMPKSQVGFILINFSISNMQWLIFI
ncbi:MAG: hypothetical protein BAA00_16755 [Parageobacillus thermoglucosidasius]|nr:hypothetical protein [Parageobacillus thermoglucosidasius]OUM88947.1 MAG: hypothetical protein BAA00_16755 [Parageobacillus thermoglucosidasius]RDE35629.1 hypothetical protein DV713_04415 [Parageobacillus thermoglucosidasius]